PSLICRVWLVASWASQRATKSCDGAQSYQLMGKRNSRESGPSGMLRARWRLLSVALLLIVLLGFIVALAWIGTPRAMRAAMALGGTLAGMLALAVFVCRR
ncbi:hypothetical protein ACQV88_26305, partial [Ralstonia pseudosolanacearum]|uniref:hypothetical protein n=1 Tax=Ralstonia pseudosolanacearum TaxID=1310165 RepID=UPI003D2B98D4